MRHRIKCKKENKADYTVAVVR